MEAGRKQDSRWPTRDKRIARERETIVAKQ